MDLFSPALAYTSVTMAPKSSGLDPDLVPNTQDLARVPKDEPETESRESLGSEDIAVQIPLHKWVMHGAVMFGREFCYAMETALVTPVLLQIGLPEQYYSLTWFLSPILGLLFTPLIGTASDRCSSRWGRRRPFILLLCIGVFLGVALFLNGSLIGLSIGDKPGKQTIGIVLSVLGVVLLDFCADAAEGPIRAYLLDVASNEDQDMALNIHAFSAGLGGAVGYMMGGLDWTHTLLGRAFKSQEQILFFFASILLIVSVCLHLSSIDEQKYSPEQDEEGEKYSPEQDEEGVEDEIPETATLPLSMPYSIYPMHSITDEGGCNGAACLMRSKSDSVLAVWDGTLDLKLDEGTNFFGETEPSVFQDAAPLDPGSISGLTNPLEEPGEASAMLPLNDWLPSLQSEQNNEPNGESSISGGQAHTQTLCPTLPHNYHGSRLRNSSVRRRRLHSFYQQTSLAVTSHGRVGYRHYRRRHSRVSSTAPIKPSHSLSDLYDIHKRQHRQQHRRHAECHRGVRMIEKDEESEEEEDTEASVRLLWLSMLKMPPNLLRLCVCHLLTWFAVISQAVFYTDFMGQVIYKGDPKAAANSTDLQNYNKGVQMGCWGLVVYAATAAICSALLQKYLDHFDLSIKVIYMLGTLGFTVGTAVMAIFPGVYVTMVMISTMGVISMSISYCPYALLGQYHDIPEYINHSPGNSKRGFGIDCAILTCQVYISQILVASALGAVVDAVGTVRVIPMVASGGAFLGFLTSTFLVIYPSTMEDEDEKNAEDDKDNVD